MTQRGIKGPGEGRGWWLRAALRPHNIVTAVAIPTMVVMIVGTVVSGTGTPASSLAATSTQGLSEGGVHSDGATTTSTPATTTSMAQTGNPADSATHAAATSAPPRSPAAITTTVPAPGGQTNDPAQEATSTDDGIIASSGGRLTLDGQPYQFTGLNAYELGTEWGTNSGCGSELTDAQLDDFFASLRPNSLVRFWAFQGTIATNINTHQLDWGPIDRVFAAAQAHGQRLIVSLTDQGGTCDNGHWKDPAWYDGGFQQVFNDPSTTDGSGLTPLSYWTYLQDIVNRYKDSPALGMWEPINEPEASTCPAQDEPTNCGGNQTCPDEAVAAAALRHFFDMVGGEIHALDPNHLVEDATIGSGQCGTQGSDFTYVSASPGIDVMSYHDYSDPTVSVFSQQWNGTLAWDFQQAADLGKPIIGGESGIEAGTSGCPISLSQRAGDLEAKIQAQLNAGSSGVLPWGWVPVSDQSCGYEIAPGDPLLGVLATIPLDS